jgi:hypothetical protein
MTVEVTYVPALGSLATHSKPVTVLVGEVNSPPLVNQPSIGYCVYVALVVIAIAIYKGVE